LANIVADPILDTDDDRVKMSICVLKDKGVLKRMSNEWKWRGEFLKHLLRADVHTDALIQLQIFELFAKFAAALYHLPIATEVALVDNTQLRDSMIQRNNSSFKAFVELVRKRRLHKWLIIHCNSFNHL